MLDILSIDPANQEALNGMMTVSIMAKQPQEARQGALKMVSLYPNEKTSYYCVGFADWSVIYPRVMAVRAAAGMEPQDTSFIADPGFAPTCATNSVPAGRRHADADRALQWIRSTSMPWPT